MKIREGSGLPPPPAQLANQHPPSARQQIITLFKGLTEEDHFLVFEEAARTQRETAVMLRTIAYQIGMKLVIRQDPDGKTVRVWRKM
jgi:hypothetical protein